MSLENVKKELERKGIEDHLTVHTITADTVEHAAALLGCEPAAIAKSMTFEVAGAPILIVAAGDVKISNSKFKAKFHVKASMIPRDDVENKIGHRPGGVCPFGLKPDVKIYLDESLKRLEVVHASGGQDNATVRLTISELEKYTDFMEWVDVCINPTEAIVSITHH